jgi:hypothetical protein
MMSIENQGSVGQSVKGICEAFETGAIGPEVAAAHALLSAGSVAAAIDGVGSVRPPPSGTRRKA